MLDSFILVLTLCGSLHTGTIACEDFVIDSEQTEISCLQGIQGVYNKNNQKLLGIMQEARNDWYKSVTTSKLTCTQEDKE